MKEYAAAPIPDLLRFIHEDEICGEFGVLLLEHVESFLRENKYPSLRVLDPHIPWKFEHF